jgi:hypothetical protein
MTGNCVRGYTQSQLGVLADMLPALRRIASVSPKAHVTVWPSEHDSSEVLAYAEHGDVSLAVVWKPSGLTRWGVLVSGQPDDWHEVNVGALHTDGSWLKDRFAEALRASWAAAE